MVNSKWLAIASLLLIFASYSSSNLHPPAVAAAADANYYVDGLHGSDSNPGTSLAQPWRTIQKAANAMTAGDTATILAGDYAERVQVTRSGVAGAPIAYRAQGVVTLKGFTVRANYITIAGFDISNTPNQSTDGWGIFVEGSNCLIEGNYVHFATRGGIIIWAKPGNEAATNHCTVQNNRLYRNAFVGIEVYGIDNLLDGNEIWGTIQYHPNWINPPSWVDADGIHFFGSGHVIKNNYIHDISYRDPENINPHIDCFQTYTDPSHAVAHDIIFENNLCKNLEFQPATTNNPGHIGKAFMIEGGAYNLTIRNNLLQAFCGIVVVGAHDLAIANNTFASDLSFPPNYGPSGVSLTRAANIAIKNNIFYDFPAPSIWVADSASYQGLDAAYNLVYRSDMRRPSGSPDPHDLWQVDPKFVNVAGGEFSLQANSPAVDAGITLAVVTDDFVGNPRPSGARYDIGAYERPVTRMTAVPAEAYVNWVISFTITFAGNVNPVSVIDGLPASLVYLSSSTTCPGAVSYDGVLRQVTYSGSPQAGLACTIQIATRANINQRIVVTNTARIENSPAPPEEVSAVVRLSGLQLFLPMLLVSH